MLAGLSVDSSECGAGLWSGLSVGWDKRSPARCELGWDTGRAWACLIVDRAEGVVEQSVDLRVDCALGPEWSTALFKGTVA